MAAIESEGKRESEADLVWLAMKKVSWGDKPKNGTARKRGIERGKVKGEQSEVNEKSPL